MSTMRWLASALKPSEPPAAFSAARRRLRGGERCGSQDLRRGHALRGERGGDPVLEIIGISRVVDMLELAAAAFGEVAAGRRPDGAGRA